VWTKPPSSLEDGGTGNPPETATGPSGRADKDLSASSDGVTRKVVIYARLR